MQEVMPGPSLKGEVGICQGVNGEKAFQAELLTEAKVKGGGGAGRVE